MVLVLSLLLAGFAVAEADRQAAPKRAPDVRYEPSEPEIVSAMLKLANVTGRDVVYDLGCGDGRIVIAAAKQYGARGVGIDIDPERIKEARENARKAGVTSRVTFRNEDLFEADIRDATVVMLYLWPWVNLKLRPKLWSDLKPGTRIVSHSHDMGDWKPEKEIEVNGHTIYFWTIPPKARAEIGGELRQWHTVTLTFDGPLTSEDATPNPFLDYRLNVTFTHAKSGKSYTIPGYYAADGRAAETSAKSGGKWRVHFLPDREGEWRYRASFRAGRDVAISLDPEAGSPAAFDGASGSFRIAAAKAAGVLQYVGKHHLRYAGSGEYFLKGGADSPENFLAYHEFDGTYDADADSGSYKAVGTFIHKYKPHVKDWRPGDPSWQNGKGKGIIGALNYLAGKGVNSVYFLTYNLDGGDGRDTWMWTGPQVRDRFDVSKLDQWEIVFSHMDRKGMMLHVVTQEAENDRSLGGGPELNPIRKLYYRELCARFSHHPAVMWNLGEENHTSDKDRKEIARYIRAHDAYRHPITVHTFSNKELEFYNGLFGDEYFEATSIQAPMPKYNMDAVTLRKRSAAAGRPWVIFGDEQPPAHTGVKPDADDPDHDEPRIHALWGNLIGGGSGVEWYFGSKYPHMDINCEDFRSRDRMWDQTRYALEFFRKHLPFWEMEPAADARVLAQGDAIFAVQLPSGGEGKLKLGAGTYTVRWYNPRSGGELLAGSVKTVQGPGVKSIGAPPSEPGKDWVALVKR